MATEKQQAFVADLVARRREEMERRVTHPQFNLGYPPLDVAVIGAADGQNERPASVAVARFLFDMLTPSQAAIAAMDGKAVTTWIDCLKLPFSVANLVKAAAFTTGRGKARFGWTSAEPDDAFLAELRAEAEEVTRRTLTQN